MFRSKFNILLVFLLLTGNSFGGKVKRGFEALEIYNYFEAKRLFEKAMKHDEVASAYGLSIIYQRTDNPFSNIDSAYKNIVIAFKNYPVLKLKQKIKYAELGIDSSAIVTQRDLISSILYRNTREVHTISAYQQFISKNPWSENKDSAIYFRDYLAFQEADQIGSAEQYSFYMQSYPGSVFSGEARSKYEKTLYLEHTSSNSFISYVDFIQKYPNSPYRSDAEDRVFEIYTKTGSKQSYQNFIAEYPDNRNVPLAWKHLYNSHLEEEYSPDMLVSFSNEFPDYPFQEELAEEIALANSPVYPIKINELWGFVDTLGQTKVKPVYQGVEWFSEGLAVVKINDKYGFINKRGQLEIPAIYDDALNFHEGHAIVEVEDKWGMINRNGEYVIPTEYEDLGILEGGLTYFQSDNELYGYFDSKGIERLKPVYDIAYSFNNDRAIVSYQDYYGLIDAFGTTFIPFKYEDLRNYEDKTYAALLIDKWGLITEMGDTILPFEFDFIGDMKDNRALIEKDETFNYIDPSGNYLLDNWIDVYPEYKQLAVFNEGHALIHFEKGFNLIDTSGKKLFAKDKEGLGDYGHLIAVKKGEEWGYMDKTGRLTIDYQYSQALSFKGKYAIAGMDPFFGLINSKGQYVIEAKYEELGFLNDSVLVAKSMGRYGLLNTSGDTLLQFHYISIEPIDDLVVKIEEGGELFYFDLRRRVFIRRED